MWLWALVACRGVEPAVAPPPVAPPPVAPPSTASAPPVEAAPPVEPAPLRFVESAGHGEALPLVIVVHGLGDTPPNMIRLLSGYPRPIRVVAPEGVKAHGDGYSWFDFRWEGGAGTFDSAEVVAAADKIVALARWVGARSGVAGKPVLTGFSQGGIVTFAAAVRHPDAFAAFVPIAGYLPADLVPSGAPSPGGGPIRALHGEEDATIPFSKGRRTVQELARRGYDATLDAFPGVEHEIPDVVLDAAHAHIGRGLGQ